MAKINNVILGNVREGRLVGFDPKSIELVVDRTDSQITTIRRYANSNDLIERALYEVEQSFDGKSSYVHLRGKENVTKFNNNYSKYQQQLIGAVQW